MFSKASIPTATRDLIPNFQDLLGADSTPEWPGLWAAMVRQFCYSKGDDDLKIISLRSEPGLWKRD